ncbi:MAG: ABC transporter permease [Prevotella sp.]|jgi:putative ABC transport system permease protein|nr:ABC transporter permease [Prevotella sp.]
MFDFDSFREITSTISKNKMRTFLTGLAVAWGIFMLIILLAAGNGFENGVKSNFAGRAKNSVVLWPGWTSMPYAGLPVDRNIKFDYKAYDLLRNQMPNVEYVSPQIQLSVTVSYEKEYGTWGLRGVTPDAAMISSLSVKSGNGRFINDIDMQQLRKVIVISDDIKNILFKNEDPVGKYVIAGNLAYRVVGVYERDANSQMMNNPPAYIPFTTAQTLYNRGYGFRQIEFTVTGLRTVEDNENYMQSLRERLGKIYNFDPQDLSALHIWNRAEDSVNTENMFAGINLVIWIIGILSLLGGLVGIGNIMLITVKERTKEIGIRKAIGATPLSILKLIVFEAVLITAVSGYAGMLCGIGLTEMINAAMEAAPATESEGPTMFLNPTVDLAIVTEATLFLIVAGTLSGLWPAIKATRVSPVEAMRAE